ncbi:ubiquinone anaerobic biosynthesis accessory factor UbiT [Agaribacterium haliotis]|uniref:ubiquinone anaerobic biosynthesis accessory factor UbiT n=1 Tax=Agaribacterium haliotis TaxID=2013869 RepID=UPI000BB588BA|nr:SCP2 sterol-binding domain-containing protein [Agaribacterium haliotis]
MTTAITTSNAGADKQRPVNERTCAESIDNACSTDGGANSRSEALMSNLARRFQPVQNGAQVFARALSLAPASAQALFINKLLKQAFRAQLEQGELDFLQHRICKVQVETINVSWLLTYDGQNLRLCEEQAAADVTISAGVTAYLRLLSKEVDPDTLFFDRELLIEGDTALGLHIKNLLDALDEQDLQPAMQRLLVYLRHFLRLEL